MCDVANCDASNGQRCQDFGRRVLHVARAQVSSLLWGNALSCSLINQSFDVMHSMKCGGKKKPDLRRDVRVVEEREGFDA